MQSLRSSPRPGALRDSRMSAFHPCRSFADALRRVGTGPRQFRFRLRTPPVGKRPVADVREQCDQRSVSSVPTCQEPLETFVRPMLGLPAWGVRQGHGSFLTFEFGEPKLEVHERHSPEKGLRRSAHVHGRWHLWIYCCHWRALQDGTQLAWSEDAEQIIGRATATLNGQKLVDVSVAPEHGRSTFSFDLGGLLETWPYGDDLTDEQWTLLTDVEAFAYRADGTYASGRRNTPPDLRRWLPLR